MKEHESKQKAGEEKYYQNINTKSISETNFVPSPCPDIYNRCFSGEDIIEFISRPARKRIVTSLCRALVDDKEKSDMGLRHKRRGRPYCSGVTLLSSRLGVSRKSVTRWLSGEMQSSNSNAVKILEMAREYIPESLGLILREELEKHSSEVTKFLRGRGGGS